MAVGVEMVVVGLARREVSQATSNTPITVTRITSPTRTGASRLDMNARKLPGCGGNAGLLDMDKP